MHNQNANAVRMLAIDAIERAHSGHPGAVMGMADIATVLWKHFVRHDPNNPQLPNRDRIIFSNGHASMLLYSALHLLGYKSFTIESIKEFRQLGALTTGHPEYNRDAGIEYTTGPLGQGLAGAVGMALGERICAARYNKEGYSLFDNYTYVFVGDGCLMEGISHEVCSLAGTLGLGKLIVLYDCNGISIDGQVNGWFSENVPMRFRGYGWNVIEGVDGHDVDAIYTSLSQARAYTNAPTLICYNTVIGYGSPHKSGTAKVHGAPLGKEEVEAVRKAYGWTYGEFEIPADIYEYWNAEKEGEAHSKAYEILCDAYKEAYPVEWEELEHRRAGIYPESLFSEFEDLKHTARSYTKEEATRISSNIVLSRILPHLPSLIGGSADLTPSVGTHTPSSHAINAQDYSGNYISYGVREFGMYAIMNGLSLYEGIIPYGGTFLVFADYAKPALRLSAMMQNHAIWIFTHDSIGVGEDGPTHQPIEQLTMLQSIPMVHVWRPCDMVETVYAWEFALQHKGPIALILSRQNVPQIERLENTQDIALGGYIVHDHANCELVLLATGSEVSLAVRVHEALAKDGIFTRVVSMPCPTLFDLQSIEYQKKVLCGCPIITIEASNNNLWYKYMTSGGLRISIEEFGASGKGTILFEHFGFNVDSIVEKIHAFRRGA